MKKTLLAQAGMVALATASVTGLAPAVMAQAPNDASARSQVEVITVTTGTRRQGRTDTQSLVPIDVISPDELVSTGYVDVNDALRTSVPAFNVQRLPLNDGSSFVRPATLRASPADHVLLLLNGQRRHRSSVVQIGTGHATTSGSQGQDFNMIPPIALGSIEVLRDGASAQYGSDAIAGVINMNLRDSNEGATISAHAGRFYDGGDVLDLQGNIGLPLTANGFINLSFQVTEESGTYRHGPHAGAEALRAQGVQNVPLHPINLGDPAYSAIKTSWNAGLDLGNGMDAYLFGNAAFTDSEVGFVYRQSQAAGGLGRHATYAPSAFQGTPAHPEAFDLAAIYPGGYVPMFGGEQTDFSTVIGVRREESDSFGWDVSARWGQNEIDYRISNTINASMGVDSPTSFRPGSLRQREYQLNADFYKSFGVAAFASDLFFFGGLSYRNEAYTIGVGDPASYRIGPLRDLPVGANGFQGFSPDAAGEFETDSIAAYLEVEADITNRWSFAAALRFEDYEAFGDNLSYKLATRYDLTDNFAIRGAVSTGFRAPAAGQLFGQSQTSQLNMGDFVLDAVLVPGSAEAQIFGSTPLVPETSTSISGGFVMTAGALSATLDFYQIDVDDRLLLNDSITTNATQRAQLAALGYPNGGSVQTVRYFQNRLDTRVRGFDLVASYLFDWNNGQTTNLSLATNYNEQSLRSDPAGVFSPAKVQEFERGTPRWRSNITLTHTVADFELMGRAVYYGTWRRLDGATNFLPRDAEVLYDAEVRYRGFENVTVTLGGRNLGNTYPPGRSAALDMMGMIYDNHSVFGTSGGYYYLGLSYDF
ncbi:TonB-dependent receptor plug domain-containing protein [Glycocaulis sp.]|uniref:TonB-dependent receptor plug domain-containing protein n=1 Tax=Glycocaulis sp. TaxID=1969725 RepID=UPI003F7251B9